ncbi:hypothetical protein R1flu_009318 [Riccia fluitans]|uniref:PGG domain-containing protein n=1 Tax=Riccia fluitans TaxID=41844 RepID=A0ABD1Z269_9MARC
MATSIISVYDESLSPEIEFRTELHEAAEENDHERLVEISEKEGFQELLDARDEHGRTALLIACQRGHTNIVVLLLEKNANALIAGRGGYTCLHEAAFIGNFLVVDLLLGGIVEITSPQGYKEVVVSIFESYLDILFELNDPYIPRPDFDLDDKDRVGWERFQTSTRLPELIQLRRKTARASHPYDTLPNADHTFAKKKMANGHHKQNSGVKWAKDAEYHKRMVDARLDLAIYVNAQDCLGRTAIHYAAWRNKVSVINDLIFAGANVNVTDSHNFTPLHFAARNGNSRVVSELILLSTDWEKVYLLAGNVAAKSCPAPSSSSSSPSSSPRVGSQEFDVMKPTTIHFSFPEERDGVTPLRYATEGYGNINQWIDSADESSCERDYVGVVRSLLEIMDVKDYGLFSPSFNGETVWTVVFPRLDRHYQFLRRNELQRLFNFRGAGRVHDLGKELMKKAVELAENKSDMELLLSIQIQLVWTLEEVLTSKFIHKKMATSNVGFDEQSGLTLFHFAAFAGLGTEMRGLLSVPELADCVNQCWDHTKQTPLHIAVIEGNEDVVALLVNDEKVRVIEEDYKKRTPLQIAVEKSKQEKFSDSWKNIEKLLFKRREVQLFIDRQYKDRQVYVDAANAILVGAALIASVTFVGWLQPPLGYTPFLEIPSYPPETPSPDPSTSMAVQRYRSVRAFFVFNSLSFFFAIATVVAGAGAVLPAFSFFIKDEVDLVRKWLMLTSILLVFSITFVVGAFTAAGMAALPPVLEYQAYMIVTAAIGIAVWIFILISFFYRLYVIHPYEWLTRWINFLRTRLPRRYQYNAFSIPAESTSQPTQWIDKKYY